MFLQVDDGGVTEIDDVDQETSRKQTDVEVAEPVSQHGVSDVVGEEETEVAKNQYEELVGHLEVVLRLGVQRFNSDIPREHQQTRIHGDQWLHHAADREEGDGQSDYESAK